MAKGKNSFELPHFKAQANVNNFYQQEKKNMNKW